MNFCLPVSLTIQIAQRLTEPYREWSERGVTLVEILVSMTLISLLAGALVMNFITSSFAYRTVLIRTAGERLALSKINELMIRDPASLSDANDAVELGLSEQNRSFTRTVDITVNADSSRTIEVQVAPMNEDMPPIVRLTKVALRGDE